MAQKKHPAGDVQRSWLGGGARHPKPMPRHCPNCGKDMKGSWKRACSIECFRALDSSQGGGIHE